MTYQEVVDRSEVLAAPPCLHWRGRVVYFSEAPGGPVWAEDDGCDGSWCNLTQHVLGPDDGDVHRGACMPGRSCYRAP